jgi:nondiscriminating aspartyl-tRNA synthetase
MKRTYIKDLSESKGEKVSVSGWVDVRRDHGKLIFLELRDVTGKVQMVVLPNHEPAHKAAKELRGEWVVKITGIVNERPEKMVKEDELNGDIEIEVTAVEVLSKAAELPFDLSGELNLDTYLDYLPLTLRNKHRRDVFRVQSEILIAYRNYLNSQGFTEFQAPKIIGEDAEGGASVFSFEYFAGKTASLAQSPQLYKQIMVGIFERVYTIGNVFRAEKHSTSRHLNEYTTADLEMGFIEDHHDVMKLTSGLMNAIVKHLEETCSDIFSDYEAEIPTLPKHIPNMKLREAQKILRENFDEEIKDEPDLEPQHERWICEYVKKEMNSDFVFITHYPVEKRPMYTYEDENDPGFTKSFDLLFRGVEIQSGGQRNHDYDTLVKAMEKKGVDPEKFSFYLQAFKYGMPPHGGFGMGLERFTQKFLNLDNVKNATLFPREINRIDILLTKSGEQKDDENSKQ